MRVGHYLSITYGISQKIASGQNATFCSLLPVAALLVVPALGRRSEDSSNWDDPRLLPNREARLGVPHFSRRLREVGLVSLRSSRVSNGSCLLESTKSVASG